MHEAHDVRLKRVTMLVVGVVSCCPVSCMMHPICLQRIPLLV